MKLDILAFAAHPDDAELSCGGTLAKHVASGKKTGIVDLTRGELGTRGTPELRAKEAEKAARILGVSVRDNLALPDGFFEESEDSVKRIIEIVRHFQPEIVLANAVYDRHPDHGRGGELVSRACFLAGLEKIKTLDADGKPQEAWRPKAVYRYIQDRFMKPDFVIDVSDVWDIKMKAIQAFSSQFHNPDSQEPITYISTPEFLYFLEARAREMGHPAGFEYAEGFVCERTPGVDSLFDLV